MYDEEGWEGNTHACAHARTHKHTQGVLPRAGVPGSRAERRLRQELWLRAFARAHTSVCPQADRQIYRLPLPRPAERWHGVFTHTQLYLPASPQADRHARTDARTRTHTHAVLRREPPPCPYSSTDPLWASARLARCGSQALPSGKGPALRPHFRPRCAACSVSPAGKGAGPAGAEPPFPAPPSRPPARPFARPLAAPRARDPGRRRRGWA